MKGDFSRWNHDPLDNDQGLLYQQGRVLDASDLTASELISVHWRSTAARDVIGSLIAAVPAESPDGFMVEAALIDGGDIELHVLPGRIWADGLLIYLPADEADPDSALVRIADYLPPPVNEAGVSTAEITDGVRDAVILEVDLTELNGFQAPDRLIESALGGPDTAERITPKFRFRLVRLGDGEDCHSIIDRIQDGDAGKGHLSVSLNPPIAIAGDCPVVEGGGYTGFEHNLYRFEIARVAAGNPPLFKWSAFNGGLVGRGLFTAGVPQRVSITANRTAILTSGITEFYLEALQFDDALGCWDVIYGATANLDANGDLIMTAPATFGAFPGGADTRFFRLWNGVELVSNFTNAITPIELRDGIRLVFDSTATHSYRAGDYWMCSVRAGEISNPQLLIDDLPPQGLNLRRVPLAEINWTADGDTRISGFVEDCRRRFRPLTNQKICCTFLVGNGVTSFGDFNSLELAAAHLPPGGGELCLLPGLHFANLTLSDRFDVHIKGCWHKTFVMPRLTGVLQPIIRIEGGGRIRISELDLFAPFGTAIDASGSLAVPLGEIDISRCRILARLYGIRIAQADKVTVAYNIIWMLDMLLGRFAVSLQASNALVERNTLGVWPIDFQPPTDQPDDPDNPDPTDPCIDADDLYGDLGVVQTYVIGIWIAGFNAFPEQPYRTAGGLHLRGSCDHVTVLENNINGGAGHGITLGGLLPAEWVTPADDEPEGTHSVTLSQRPVNGFVVDEVGGTVAGVNVFFLDSDVVVGMATSNAGGAFALILPAVTYTVNVADGYEIIDVRQEFSNDEPIIFVVVSAAQLIVDADKGHLYSIKIQGNHIENMGFSGIGFLPHNGRPLEQLASAVQAELLFANLITLVLAPPALVLFTNTVSDLVIDDNHIHDNLRVVFTPVLRAVAQIIGQGGITLAQVEAASITDNRVLNNGISAVDPCCGIFIGYGEDVEISRNQIIGNGPLDTAYDDSRTNGTRGGIFVRFASAYLLGGEPDALQKPALVIRENRIDQPAGRCITAIAYGPVAITANYLNSEREGSSLLDRVVGNVLLLNAGGIHRHLPAGFLEKDLKLPRKIPNWYLPGGETLFSDNQVRCGVENRAVSAVVMGTMDDLGMDSNQISMLTREGGVFSNTILVANSLRATGNRFKEDTGNCFMSLLSLAGGITAQAKRRAMNMTATNQADHCIIAMVQPVFGGVVGALIDSGNQVVFSQKCPNIFNDDGAGTVKLAYIKQAIAALSNQAVTVPDTVDSVSQEFAVELSDDMLATVSQQQYSDTREEVLLTDRYGGDHKKVAARKKKRNARMAVAHRLEEQVQLVGITEKAVNEKEFLIDGRVSTNRRPVAGLHVAIFTLADEELLGESRSDLKGYFAIPLAAELGKSLLKQAILIEVRNDKTGETLFKEKREISEHSEAGRWRTSIELPAKPLDRKIVDSIAKDVAKRAVNARAADNSPATGTKPVAATDDKPESDHVLDADEDKAVRQAESMGTADVTATTDTPADKPKFRLQDITGIGPKRAKQLRQAGIETVADILATSDDELQSLTGLPGENLKANAAAALEAERDSEKSANNDDA